jgi:protein TonB
MIRQLFASAGGVPEGRRTTGAAPFSLVLHAAAVGALLFFSSQKVASTDTRLPIPVYQPPVATAVPATTPEVRVSINTHPRAPEHPAAAPKSAMPSVPTATPFVEPQEVPTGIHNPVEETGPTPAPYGSQGPGCTGNCSSTGTPGDPDGSGPGGGEGVIHVVEASVEAPRKLHDVVPIYPEIMHKNRLSGVVHIECVIGPDGNVRDARVLDGNSIFAASALNAVRQWVYTPSRYNGRPVSVIMTVTVRFVLKY